MRAVERWLRSAGSNTALEAVVAALEESMVGWDEIDVSSWPTIGTEPRGKRPKQWVRRPSDGSRWLRKEPRLRTKQLLPYEPAIEWLALRIAIASGVSAVEAHPVFGRKAERRDQGSSYAPSWKRTLTNCSLERRSCAGTTLLTRGKTRRRRFRSRGARRECGSRASVNTEIADREHANRGTARSAA